MRLACATALILWMATTPSHAGQAFLDGDFASWSFGSIYGFGPGGGTASVARTPAGGNPGAHLTITIETVGLGGVAATALKHDYMTTAPLHGATFVLSMDVLVAMGYPHGIGLLVEQYGRTYASTTLGPSGEHATFTTIGFLGTLNAGMFTAIDGQAPLNPDFNGNVPTRFGFVSWSFAGRNVMHVDNVRLDLSVSPSPCVGFDDVADTDVFCGAVGWLRNRSITAGCEDQRFCPGANVTRAQMALFLSRLGAALAPSVLYRELEYANVTVAASAPGTPTCQTTSPFAVGTYPRLARASGTISATANAGPSALQAYWMYSTDQGNTWLAMGSMAMHGSVAGPGETVVLNVRAAPMQLLPGTIYRFGMFVDGMGATPTFAPLKCQADVLVFDDSRP